MADPRAGFSRRPDGVTTFISVCEHSTPVREVRRIYNTVSETLGFRPLQRFDGGDVRQLRIILQALELVPSGLTTEAEEFDEETVEHLWAAVERAGKTEEVRALVQDIARVRR